MTKPFHFQLPVARLLNALLLFFLVSLIHPLLAQTVTTVAGTGVRGMGGYGGSAIHSMLSVPKGVWADEKGNLFIAEYGNLLVSKVSADGIISKVAGVGFRMPPIPGMPVEPEPENRGDGGLAINARVDFPVHVITDASGNLYISEDPGQVRRVSPDGIITTYAGNNTVGYGGDGGLAINAQLSWPSGLALDANGNLFIADAGNNRVRKVSPEGIITTVAGDGNPGSGGDGGLAINAQVSPSGVAISPEGILYIAEDNYGRIRKVSPEGIITTVAGNGNPGSGGDGGPATNASIFPGSIGFDGSGNLYIGERWIDRIRKVSLDGTISTIFNVNYG